MPGCSALNGMCVSVGPLTEETRSIVNISKEWIDQLSRKSQAIAGGPRLFHKDALWDALAKDCLPSSSCRDYVRGRRLI